MRGVGQGDTLMTKQTNHDAIKTYVHSKFGLPEADPFESPSIALEEVERLIKWLGYVTDSELTKDETRTIVEGAKTFAGILQPIASKYLD
jgi:hypothetical protein